ncbi:PilZ domain-containing protein [Sphingomonas sp.]|uniref:PilZ domain-containing protein n=1 Tax=Sphingomonas sp. TaxID=28214 RepID=UPI003B0025D6
MATDVSQLVETDAGERRLDRRALAVGAARIADGGGPPDARLLDLSIYGCRLAAEVRDVGERLWLRFDGGAPIEATVVWAAAGRLGCRFDAPIARQLMRDLTRALH